MSKHLIRLVIFLGVSFLGFVWEQKPVASGIELESAYGLSDIQTRDISQPLQAPQSDLTAVSFGDFVPTDVITASDGMTGDSFGAAVAIDNNIALIGSATGAYVYVNDNSGWRGQYKIIADDIRVGDCFGCTVSLDGDTAIIGAPYADSSQGAAYVFVRNGEQWAQQQKLQPSLDIKSNFGKSVAISGNRIVVGAPGVANGGRAFVYVRTGETWNIEQQLIAETHPNDSPYSFGWSVAVKGDTVLVGAPNTLVGGKGLQGASFIYHRHGSTWSQLQMLVASDGDTYHHFGSDVALDGTSALIGALGAEAAYLIDYGDDTWIERHKFQVNDTDQVWSVGESVAIDKNVVFLGARTNDTEYANVEESVYIFSRGETGWTQSQKILPNAGNSNDGGPENATSVAISGDVMLLGSYFVNGFQGEAYFFERMKLRVAKSISPGHAAPTSQSAISVTVTLAASPQRSGDGPVKGGGYPTVFLTDTIPVGLNLIPGSITSTPDGAALDPSNPRRILWAGPIHQSTGASIEYQVTLAPNVEPGSVLGSEVVATTAAGDHYSAQAALAVEDSTFGGALMLIYIGADTAEDGFNVGHGDLSDDAIRLVNQAELKANTPGVRTIVMLDGPYEDDARIYNLKYDADLSCPNLQNPYCANRQAPYIEGVNTFTYGDGTANRTSLAEFVISASLANPNAEMILLSLVGHGGGWSPELLKGQPTKHGGQPSKRGGQPDDAVAELSGGLLWDMHYADALTVADVANALQMVKGATGKSVDLLYLDACLMAMSEVANELRDGAGYLLASESWSWTSFPYGEHIADVGAVVAGNAVKKEKVEAIGRAWLENEVIALSEEDNYPFTFSLTDLGRMPALVAAQNNLAEALIAEFDGDALQTRERMDRAFATAECVDSNQSGRIEHDAVIGWADNYCDLGTFATNIAREFSGTENVVGAAEDLQRTLAAAVVANQFRSGIPHEYSELPWQWADLRGLTIYLPLRVDNWKRRYYNDIWLPSSKGSRWGAMLAKYWDNTSEPDAIDHPDPTCPEDGCQLPPPGLTAIDLDAVAVKGNNGIRIDWWVSSGVETVSDFTVQRVLLPLPGKPTTLTTMANPISSPSQPYSYLDASAAGTYEYCYQVIAHGPGRERLALSNFTCAVAGADSIPLSPPPSLSVGEGSILVEWGTVQAAEVGGFRVYRSANRGVSMPRSDTLLAGTLYTDEAVWPGVEYCYRIHSIGPTGQLTAISQEACTSIGSAPFYTHLPLIGR